MATVAGVAFLAVILHNCLGLSLGYGSSRVLGLDHRKSKAISFEIGMENSGLAVALAMAHLEPLAAIPGAIFSFWATLSGAMLASFWATLSGAMLASFWGRQENKKEEFLPESN